MNKIASYTKISQSIEDRTPIGKDLIKQSKGIILKGYKQYGDYTITFGMEPNDLINEMITCVFERKVARKLHFMKPVNKRHSNRTKYKLYANPN